MFRLLRRKAHSVPILIKVLGVGALVGTLFGTTTLLQVHASMRRILDERQQGLAYSAAQQMATELQRPLIRDDRVAVAEAIERQQQRQPDLRYVLIRTATGDLIADSFGGAVPVALLMPPEQAGLRRLGSSEGLVVEMSVPRIDEPGGLVQVGVIHSDGTISWFLPSIASGLLLCVVLGIGLAYLLAAALTNPIRALVRTTRQITEGDYAARTGIMGEDEVGQLGRSFDQMASALQRQHEALVANERERGQLLDRVVQAQEEERLAISQELHDHFGQTLLAILLAVEARSEIDEETNGERTAFIAEQIRGLIEDARRLAWGIRPPVLDDYGLIAGLERYAEEVQRFSDLRISVAHVGMENGGRLPSRIEVTLYRIAQEAISNVIRHAEAKQASIVLIRRPQSVILVVEDDGQGFPPERNGERPHLGLTGMRERAQLLGGGMILETRPDEGVTVRIEIPLEGNAS